MEPWQSWAAIIVGGGAIYCYYYGVPGLKENTKSAPQQLGNESAQPRKAQRREDGKTKRRTDGPVVPPQSMGSDPATSGNDEPTAKRKNTKRATTQAPSASSAAHPTGHEKDDETDVKNWAAELVKLKEGSNLAPPSHTNQRLKTVRQSAANTAPEFSAASSNAPADADDEMSPAVSPALQADASGADVSDMLETPTPGPSTLRLTEPTNLKPAKQQRKQASPQPQETKKQRQNRQKVEARKLEREEQEKARRVLEEKQRRTARESRGEPAKNGVTPAKAPASSAWTQGAPDSAVQAPPADVANSAARDTQLLDTFDQDTTASTASSSNRAASPGSNTTAGTNWDGPLPSEEEQLRIINENDDATWSTVPTGKKNKKKGTTPLNGEVVNRSGSDSSVPALTVTRANDPSKDAKSTSKAGSYGGFGVLDNGSEWANTSQHPGDSDWSVV
ncbi:MAG: hypothetical protein M1822_003960 [Bathelium mastoideum]|nr:MAG: hypothetical protein M1822_003960 [Bathelium mastoideum]